MGKCWYDRQFDCPLKEFFHNEPKRKSVKHGGDKNNVFNGWQLAKMKKSIPDMSLP